jgi:hypothetical protein
MMTRRLFSILGPVVTLAGLAYAADGSGSNSNGVIAPVLRHSEPPDSVFVTLPGPAPEPIAAPAAPPTASAGVRRGKTADEARPFLRRVKPDYPPGFEQDSPKFLQERIGQWKEFDVHDLLGPALRQRPSFDDAGAENGIIYAFADPIGRDKEIELDFAGDTGSLRTVFIYPLKLTWQACRLVYGASVTAADAPQGRKFYSYLNRRMDVLVDSAGRVISLGLY